ncbi:MAG: type I-C CRISPR-associated protein Cas8c/Csd1 [Lachnospiraceae bacterium]|nr:type I-C CRISPR-associated protein Cas8c/Csd1 [Lachnospiraceae bacterium]
MIFYELTRLYEKLVKQGKIGAPGWMDEKVSYGILLGKDGEIRQLLSLKDENGKPRKMRVPEHQTRTSGVLAFFLWDNAGYLLGTDGGGKPEKAMERFAASQKKHLELLEEVHTEAAEAVKNFFGSWNPKCISEHEVLKPEMEELQKGANLVFYYEGKPVAENPEIREAWEQYRNREKDGESGICLVTGKREPIARLHPLIKGVWGAQSSGASLVSFNAEAFCSYEMENGGNAQTGESAARAYGAALNYLLSDSQRVFRAGDVTVVGWAFEGNTVHQDILMAYLNQEDSIRDADVQAALKKLCRGEKVEWKDQELRPDHLFYILGLSPNAARLSVRFFLKDQFGRWLANIRAHEKRLEIVLPAFVKKPYLPVWVILDEMKAPGGKDKLPTLTTAFFQSVLMDSRYPEELLFCTLRRIRADHDLNWKRAAMLKAYLWKNSMSDKNKEGCSVGLNMETNHQAYLLGRLFSLLENVQVTAAKGKDSQKDPLNTTIKDRYLNSMCCTPVLAFAPLLKLKESHMKKLKRDRPELADKLEMQIVEIIGRLEAPVPRQFGPEEQAVFMLGYYHQTQTRYEKKEEA